MKKLYSLLLAILITNTSLVYSQIRKHNTSAEINQERIAAHPELLLIQSQLEKFAKQYTTQHANQSTSSTATYIIPVVVHVLHNYGTENISDAQVRDAIRQMNEDFQHLSPDTINIVPSFQSIAADCEIEFRLATLDPNGNCTNGIEHIASPLTYLADDNSKLNPWPNDRYLNIWTAATLLNSAAAGYSHLPGGSANKDGIMILSNYVGTIGTGSLSYARLITQLLGYYLNLRHPWGSGTLGITCGDDGIADTPETMGWDHCDLTGSVCNPPIIENVQNFMEFSYCQLMFTQGQKLWMHATLNSSVGGRNNLWTPSNLVATGTDTINLTPCIPIADIETNVHAICEGDNITFSDCSWNAEPTSWLWTFTGGTPSTSTDSMPTILYSTAGVYDVSLIVSNASGSDTITRVSNVRVFGTPPYSPPFTDDFETVGTFPGSGYVINNDSLNTWERIITVGYSGTSCIEMANYSGNTIGQIDSWVTPAFDFTNFTTSQLKFQLAYAQSTPIGNDELKIYMSIDCGKNWIMKYSKAGSSLATNASLIQNFTPSSLSDWRLETVNMGQANNKPNVQFKFEFISDSINNLYIDDINIVGTPVGLDVINAEELNLSVSPNPSNGNCNLSFTLYKNAFVNVSIVDLAGRKVMTVLNEAIESGTQNYAINTSTLSKGIYFVRSQIGNFINVKKLVIQ